MYNINMTVVEVQCKYVRCVVTWRSSTFTKGNYIVPCPPQILSTLQNILKNKQTRKCPRPTQQCGALLVFEWRDAALIWFRSSIETMTWISRKTLTLNIIYDIKDPKSTSKSRDVLSACTEVYKWTLCVCRSVVRGSVPRGCELRRLQPHPHRHLPHTLRNHRSNHCRRSLHEPNRYRSTVTVTLVFIVA